MKRPDTIQCRVKCCPHLQWEWYSTATPSHTRKRRLICMLLNKQPSNMYFCPMSEQAEPVMGEKK
ncbi:MAG: hypothetical protein LUQ50_15280 [Methanospirillum sp.]|uniref:hypothetical protein n=1 Tax=Methanospirillum sp. TaxID=45200 RepID=UPI00236F861C|nr:hypothetical protein [Methanospirillum sp.]MDD1730416.1 hypothetical protein [Methanospirillum sp.]